MQAAVASIMEAKEYSGLRLSDRLEVKADVWLSRAESGYKRSAFAHVGTDLLWYGESSDSAAMADVGLEPKLRTL